MGGENRVRGILIAIFAFAAVRIASFLLVTWHSVAHRMTRFDLLLGWIFYPEELIAIHTPLGQVNPPMLFVAGFTCLILLDSVLIVILISQGTKALKRLFAVPRLGSGSG